LCNTERIAGVCLVTARAKELTELACFIQVDRIAEAAQASCERNSAGTLEADPGEAAAPQPTEFRVNAFHIGAARRLLQHLTAVRDDADACCFNPDVKACPNPCQNSRPFESARPTNFLRLDCQRQPSGLDARSMTNDSAATPEKYRFFATTKDAEGRSFGA
jgi:hypothetical protein